MLSVIKLTFNPFQENTYILHDETKECVIVDPGCYDGYERKSLNDLIIQRQLKPVRLVNTHCHIDHILGNNFVFEKWGLLPEIHEGELPVMERLMDVAMRYGIPNVEDSPRPERYLSVSDKLEFGNTKMSILLTPGHSPASICFYDAVGKQLIAGDVLFEGSIGRTDLPGGDYDTLMTSIEEQIMPLPDDVRVYPGHGNHTTIGKERRNNPYFLDWLKHKKQ